MANTYYPNEVQLFELYRFLTLLRTQNIFWHTIGMKGDRIIVKAEPPKGENEIRVFYINKEGEVKDDDFREQLFGFD